MHQHNDTRKQTRACQTIDTGHLGKAGIQASTGTCLICRTTACSAHRGQPSMHCQLKECLLTMTALCITLSADMADKFACRSDLCSSSLYTVVRFLCSHKSVDLVMVLHHVCHTRPSRRKGIGQSGQSRGASVYHKVAHDSTALPEVWLLVAQTLHQVNTLLDYVTTTPRTAAEGFLTCPAFSFCACWACLQRSWVPAAVLSGAD